MVGATMLSNANAVVKTDWHKCHGQGWTGIITPESFAHPAKFSRALIRRIYAHAIEQGYIAPGAVVVDCFAGVALGALHAMQNGLHWFGCELEEKFVSLGRENIALWNRRYSKLLPGWGTARLLQGDSRRLGDVLGAAGGLVGSPPWEQSLSRDTTDKVARVALARKLGISNVEHISPIDMENVGQRTQEYGASLGQMGAMPSGDVAAVLGSPPHGSYAAHGRSGPTDAAMFERQPGKDGQTFACEDYGDTPGQMGAMRAGALVSSPPYEGSINAGHDDNRVRKRKAERYARGEFDAVRPDVFSSEANIGARGMFDSTYGKTDGQVGAMTKDTFWQAAQAIMSQCYQILTPGSVAIWVLKAFVRNKAIVDFPGQWQQLGEACGFETVEIIRAWLVEDRGAQWDLFGELHEKTVERKSFFRRLYEKKYPGNSIDYEVVLIQRKPL